MRRAVRWNAGLWRCLLVCGWLAWMEGPAWASHYPEALNLAQLTAKAERILVGEVVARQTGKDPLGLFATVYTFRVEQAPKGDVGTEVTIKQMGVAHPAEDPATGVITFPLPGIPVYETGQRYLLFLNDTSDRGFTSPVGLGYGAFVLLANGHAVNHLNNAGLFRDTPALPVSTRAREAVRAHTRGPIELSALLEVTTRLARQSRTTRADVARPPRPPAFQVVAEEGVAPRGNIGLLFNGRPFRWNVPTVANPGGSLPAVPYDVETGPLGNANNSTARAKVAESFAKWAAPATTALRVTTTPGSLGVDVNAVCPSPTCFQNWYFVFGDGRNPIIFDTDGSITQALTGNPCSFGGLAGFQGQTFNSGLTWTLEGTVVLNGAWLGGVCGSSTLDAFGHVVTHEAGHFLALAHTVVNGELLMANEPFLTFGVPPCSTIEMMLSNGIPGCSRPDVLQKDDVGLVSLLYPSASFATNLGEVQGRLFAADGVTPVNCGNIIVRNLADPFVDAVGAITGISQDAGTPPPTQAGSYRAAGLTPGASYVVGLTQIPAFAVGGSNLTDLCDPVPLLLGPEEFYNAASESSSPGVDNPSCFVVVTAGAPTTGIDIVLNSSPTSSAACDGFADVPSDHFAATWIAALVDAGVTAGCSTSPPLYCPNGPVTREQMAVFLLKSNDTAAFVPPPCTPPGPFADVPCSNPFARWIRELVRRGVTVGCGNGNYCPGSSVTREQMAVFLLKMRLGGGFAPPDCTAASFGDVPCTSGFAAWIEELVRRGITSGCAASPPRYCPTNNVTRAQMAIFLVRMFDLPL